MKFNKNMNQSILLFAAGALVSAVAGCFAKSNCCKKACVNTLAKGMKIKSDVEHCIASMKEEAEDIYNEAKMSEAKNDCCVTEHDSNKE